MESGNTVQLQRFIAPCFDRSEKVQKIVKMNFSNGDPKRIDKIIRYANPNTLTQQNSSAQPGDDLTPDYMNVLGMIFSMCALMLRMKWCAWLALYCSCISFANTKINDDTKQIMSSFMLSVSAVVMSYLQNPSPMILPGLN